MSAGSARAKATFWLLAAPDSLAVQSRREPDGTGLGWFDEHGTPLLSKQPLAAYEDREFTKEAREIESSAFVAHVRFASTGAISPENTHPFQLQGRLFAHNGVVQDLPALEAHLGSDMEMVRGATDSERVFALITREIEANGGDVEAGIRSACEWIAGHLPLFALNFVLAGDEQLWALRYPQTHELHLLERLPGATLEHSSSIGTKVRSEHGKERRLVVVASEPMDDDPGWSAMPSGNLLHIDPKLRLTTTEILRGPPAHPLTLSDLHGHARASQAAGAQPPPPAAAGDAS